MTEKTLFDTYRLGNIVLANRIVMAPLTRNRAGAGLVPSELAATYYGQRASAGLLITEATQVSPQAQGYQDTPGIYTQAQIDGWRKVTDEVHAGAGVFLCSCGTWGVFLMWICSRMALRRLRLRRFGRRPRRS